jgi:regulator of protease activity HflC (stomatin/prohibitin superfamily)
MYLQDLLKQLECLELDELLELYLEAKIGKYVDFHDILSTDALELVEQLQEALAEAIEGAKE